MNVLRLINPSLHKERTRTPITVEDMVDVDKCMKMSGNEYAPHFTPPNQIIGKNIRVPPPFWRGLGTYVCVCVRLHGKKKSFLLLFYQPIICC